MTEHVKGKPDSFIPGGVGAWLLHNSGQMTGECDLAKPVLSSPPTQENNDTSPKERREGGWGRPTSLLPWRMVCSAEYFNFLFHREHWDFISHIAIRYISLLAGQPQKFFSSPTSHRNFYVYIEKIIIIAWTLMVKTDPREWALRVLELSLRASSSPMFLEHSFLTFFLNLCLVSTLNFVLNYS